MVLKIKGDMSQADGIYGKLFNDKGQFMCITLEHAYLLEDKKTFAPKVPSGEYKCVRGMHRLHSETEPFETFEVTGVVGHTGILFHIGNYNKDSDGCILLGTGYGFQENMKDRMISNSKKAFADFMNYLKEENEFTLIIEREV